MNKEQRDIMRARVALIRALIAIRDDGPTKLRSLTARILPDIFANKDHLLAFSADEPRTQVSYATKEIYRFDEKRRTRLTFGKYYRRQIEPKWVESGYDTISDETLQVLTSYIFASQAKGSDFQIVSGSEIIKAYKNAVGAHSCMTEDCSSLVELYACNPKKVSLVIFRGVERNARALLWNTDDGTRVLDRIYPNDGPHVQAYYAWAKSQNIVTRQGNGYVDFGDPGLSDEDTHRITLERPKSGEYPYIDTFFYGEFRKKAGKEHVVLSNDQEFGDKMFHDTCGGYSSRCCKCGRAWASMHDTDESYCEDCYYETFARCDCCGDTMPREEVSEFDGSIWCEDCLLRETFICDSCDERCRDRDHAALEEAIPGDYCTECAEDKFYSCSRCHTFYKDETSIHECLDGRKRCERCCVICPRCNRWSSFSEYSTSSAMCFSCVIEARTKEVKNTIAKEKANEALAEKTA